MFIGQCNRKTGNIINERDFNSKRHLAGSYFVFVVDAGLKNRILKFINAIAQEANVGAIEELSGKRICQRECERASSVKHG